MPHVTFHQDIGAFSGNLPTKKPFIIDIRDAAAFEEVTVVYWRLESQDACPAKAPPNVHSFAERKSIDPDKKTFFVPIQPLARDARYCFQMIFNRSPNDAEKTSMKWLLADVAKNIVPSRRNP